MKGRNGKVICRIPNGEWLTLISDEGIDYRVRWNDKTGLVKKYNTVVAEDDAGRGSTELSSMEMPNAGRRIA